MTESKLKPPNPIGPETSGQPNGDPSDPAATGHNAEASQAMPSAAEQAAQTAQQTSTAREAVKEATDPAAANAGQSKNAPGSNPGTFHVNPESTGEQVPAYDRRQFMKHLMSAYRSNRRGEIENRDTRYLGALGVLVKAGMGYEDAKTEIAKGLEEVRAEQVLDRLDTDKLPVFKTQELLASQDDGFLELLDKLTPSERKEYYRVTQKDVTSEELERRAEEVRAAKFAVTDKTLEAAHEQVRPHRNRPYKTTTNKERRQSLDVLHRIAADTEADPGQRQESKKYIADLLQDMPLAQRTLYKMSRKAKQLRRKRA